MCGICGIIQRGNETEREKDTLTMSNAIFHRGPNDDGKYSDQFCTLAMRRLSIIDLETGKQPLYSSDKNLLIFFNGEIYNYKKLRKDLIAKGVVFETNSDTEVIVNLYRQHGREMLAQLHGMFAFCIYDLNERTYFFARDKFGEKPLFYFSDGRQLLFSSEIASLLSTGRFTPRLNKSMIADYLRRGFVPDPQTLLENVLSLPPGHYMEVDRDMNIVVCPYDTIAYTPDAGIRTMNDAVSLIKPLFEKSVEKQLTSDVPVGAFLSGGIDSSSVVAVMAKFSDKPVKTFTAKFQSEGYDESTIAAAVAKRFSTEHHELVVENNQFKEEFFWKILKHVGVPFADSSAIPTYLITKMIAGHVKVALSGDGGDEVFGGYTVFDWVQKVAGIKSIPSGIRKPVAQTMSFINSRFLNNNRLRQISKAFDIAELSIPEIIQETQALFSEKELDSLMNEDHSFLHFDAYNESYSMLRNAMLFRLKYDLPLDMLVKVDRMSMANSLEVRSPFLDPVLFEASCTLPDRFLRDKGLGKLVIREMMKEELPDIVFNHPKSGFSIPLHSFRNEAFATLAKRLLDKPYMKELFSAQTLNNILETGLQDENNSGSGSIYRKMHQLWSLMMFSGWIEMYEVEI